MARTEFEIYDGLIAEKNAEPTLSGLQPTIDTAQTLLLDLQSPSRVADWRLFFWIFSVAAATLEGLFDLFKADVDAKIKSAIVGSPLWYQSICFNFQLGDSLVYIDNKYQYVTIDPSLQIIKRAAVIDSAPLVVIKVAKVVAGTMAKLSAPEKSAFTAYINKVKVAGTQTVIISDDPDLFKVAATVYYDPLVMAPDGSLLSDPSIFPVQDAINGYISALEFNGDLVLNKLIDAMQVAQGVINPVITAAEAKYGAFTYTPFTVKYNAYAGYLVIDPAFPLNTQITYVANV